MEYRIVTDDFAGYEAQWRAWYWPFWTQIGFCNTHPSADAAEQFAILTLKPKQKQKEVRRSEV